jgi:hypothetical protein
VSAVLDVLLGLYFIVRAIAEAFVIDMTDPPRTVVTGPSLAGVPAVHCGPGNIAAALLIRAFTRNRSARRAARP